MGLGAKIGEAAEKRNVSLKALSRSAGIPYTTLYHMVKRDSNKIEIDVLSKIATALEMEPAELYGSEWAWMVLSDTIEKFQRKGAEDITASFLNPEELEERMEKAYYSLSYEGKRVAVERVEELAQLPKYQKHPAGDSTQSAGTSDEKAPK